MGMLIKKYKDMVYQSFHNTETIPEEEYVLAEGEERGVRVIVANAGAFPVVFVGLPESHPFFGVNHIEVNKTIKCHGWMINSDDHIRWLPQTSSSHKWWITWDYMAPGDFVYCGEDAEERFKGMRKWTVEEIVQDSDLAIREFVRLAK